ncbi:MAG: response regulator transcription factor [Bacteroidetes bacterium]|nr:response regulator transcription factor [Bacteroidota bacterium]
MKTKPINVFIVDDSAIVRERLTALLNEVPSITIVGFADNPLAATEAIVAQQPDVIILDIFLTGGSGIHVLKNIRGKHVPAKVIMLTNYAQEEYRRKCFEEGADYFYDKSIEFEKVVETIHRIAEAA